MDVEVRGPLKNLSPLPDIGFQYQDNGQPWPSVSAAHAGAPSEYLAVGKVRFIDVGDGKGIIEYWYKGGTTQAHLVPRYENLESAATYVQTLEGLKSDTETLKLQTEILTQQSAENRDLTAQPFKFVDVWNAATDTPDISALALGDTEADRNKLWYVNVPGNNDTTGAALDYEVGDGIVWSGIKWVKVKKSDLALSKILVLESVLKPNEYLGAVFPILDANGKLLSQYDQDGAFFAPKYRPESIEMSAFKDFLVGYSQISAETKGYMLKTLDPVTGYVWALLDDNDTIMMACRTNQQIYIPSLDWTIPSETINYSQFSQEARDYMFKPLDPITGFVWALLDGDGNILMACRTNQKIYIPSLDSPEIQEAIATVSTVNARERVIDDLDDLRAKVIPIPIDISQFGTLFARFPSRKTPVLNGFNTSGTDLELRKSSKLPIRATRRMGAYDPTAGGAAPVELTYISTATAAPSLSGRTDGDYYRVMTGKTSSVVINSQTCYGGDLIVYVSGAWIKKAAPSTIANARPGQWWNVTVAGSFDGVSYGIGDIIYCSKQQSAGGSGLTRFYSKLGSFEFAHYGNFDPATFVPPLSIERVVYTASGPGTYDSKAFAKYDTILRSGGAWHKIASDPVITVANGGYVNFPCQNSSDIEVRRADGTYVTVGTTLVKLSGKSANIQKTNVPDIVAFGDSMVAAALALLAAELAPRPVTLRGYPGATSEEIYSMIEGLINEGDPYDGYTHIFYHGQNELARTIEYSHRMYNISGARDRRFLFLSVLGSRGLSWNGTRLVGTTLESAFAGSGNVYEIEQAYQSLWPNNWINTRQMLLDASALLTTVPDLTFPGMTQAQVATTYGITGHSFFLDYSVGAGASQLPYPASELVFQGYHNSLSAPTGGADKDYYISIYKVENVVDDIGRIWIRSAGTWISRVTDEVHVNSTAQPIFAQKVKDFFILNKI